MQDPSQHNLIGGKHIISNQMWALSLVRKLGREHAFLVTEGMDEGDRFIRETHLIIKDDLKNTKADILVRELDVDELKKLGENCHSKTWSISREQAVALQAL
ncbi:unnamed protein product, partial [marine sediment metagenome]